jgi:hypothetical protein
MRPPQSAPHILLLLLRMSSFIPSADFPLHSNYRLQGNGGYDLRRNPFTTPHRLEEIRVVVSALRDPHRLL